MNNADICLYHDKTHSGYYSNKLNAMKATLNYLKTAWIALILFLVIGLSDKVNGSHIAGGEITYEWISGNIYKVKLAYYRDCSGIQTPSLTLNYRSVSCGLGPFNIAMTPVGTPVQVTTICAASQVNSACNGGTLYAVERNEYEAIITLPGNCTDWEFYYNECCRNAAITNLVDANLQGSYIASTLNNWDVPFNNSVQFGGIPVNLINNNITTTLGWSTYDVDGDIIQYELMPARDYSSSPINLTYNSGFSHLQPFISSVPTILDPATGLLTISPNALQVSVVSMKVSEFRSGVLIGEVYRDYQIAVISSTNTPPSLTGINGTPSFVTNGCPGDTIDFDIFSGDPDAGQNVTLLMAPNGTNASLNTLPAQYPVGEFTWSPTLSDVSAQPYIFNVSVLDDNCDYRGSQTYIYQVYVNGCNTNDVWPGDANSDGTANLYDLLAVGIAYGDTGPVRPSASILWVAQPCPDWTNSFNSGINHKHADTNGDGTVDASDLTAITANYGLNHPLRISDPGATATSDLVVTADVDTTGTLMTVNFDVSINTPVDSLYGLSFRLYFDPSLVDITTATVTYPGSMFGTNLVDMITLDHSAGLNGFVDISLSKITQQNINGSGPVARVTIVTTDNVSGKVTLNVTPSDVVGITLSEAVVNFNTTGDEVIIDPNFVGLNENNLNQLVEIYPTLASDFVQFNYAGSEHVNYIQLTDISGKIIRNSSNPTNKTTLDVRSLSKGVYFVKVGIGENSITKKLIIL